MIFGILGGFAKLFNKKYHPFFIHYRHSNDIEHTIIATLSIGDTGGRIAGSLCQIYFTLDDLSCAKINLYSADGKRTTIDTKKSEYTEIVKTFEEIIMQHVENYTSQTI